MATARPAAVAMSASEIPLATHLEAADALDRHGLEGADDADHRAEEAHVGGQRTHGAHEPEAALQIEGRLLAGGREHTLEILQGHVLPLHRLQVDLGDGLVAVLAQALGLQEIALDQGVDGVAGELARAFRDPAEAPHALEEDEERHEGAHRQGVDGQSALVQELQYRLLFQARVLSSCTLQWETWVPVAVLDPMPRNAEPSRGNPPRPRLAPLYNPLPRQ